MASKPNAALTEFLAPPQAPDELGRLGPFRVLQVLGQGGMGVVYKAEDPHLKRLVALKAMLPGLGVSESARQRFLREAQTAATITHDNIVPILQVGEDRGVPFIAMPFLEGETLDDRLKREGRLTTFEVVRIARETAQGLAAAHKRGLIHRDIKPANLWLEGERGRVKILDFGLARSVSDESHLTQSGAIIGTPAYMSPEQGAGKKVDHRCDLFSLGCVIYRSCTGVMPFKGSDTVSTLVAVAIENPNRPAEINREVPGDLSDLVMELLEKKPEQRPQSAEDVAERLREIADASTSGFDGGIDGGIERYPTRVRRPATPEAAPARSARRWLRIVAAGGACVCGLIVVAFLFLGERNGEKKAEEPKPGVVQAPSKPLDSLDPANIPADQRFEWQPSELVAIMGGGPGRAYVSDGIVPNLAFRPIGNELGDELAACNGGAGIQFWNTRPLRPIGASFGIAEALYLYGFDFLPQGNSIALLSDQALQIWDIRQKKPSIQHSIPIRERYVLGCAPDGKRFAVAGNHAISVVDLTKDGLKPLGDYWTQGEGNRVYSMAFCHGGKTLVTGNDKGILFWDVTVVPPQLKKELNRAEMSLCRLVVSADGKTLVAGSSEGSVRLWEILPDEPKVLHSLQTGAYVQSVAISADGRQVAAGGKGGKIHLWDVTAAPPRKKAELNGDSTDVYSVAFSRDGKTLAAIGSDRIVRLWDVSAEEPKELFPSTGHAGPVWSVAFSPDGKRLASGGADRSVRLWDVSGPAPKEQAVLTLHKGDVWRTQFSPDGNTLVTGSFGGETIAWDLAVDPPRGDILMNAAPAIPRVFWFDAKSRLVTVVNGQGNGSLGIWDLTGEKPAPRKLPREFYGGGTQALSTDGKRLAVGNVTDTLSILDLEGEEIKESVIPEGGRSHHSCFSPRAEFLAAAGDAGVKIWRLDQIPAAPRALQDPDGRHFAATFSHDGKRLFAVDIFGRMRCWQTETGRLVTRQKKLAGTEYLSWRLPGQVRYITLSPDGRYMATANNDGSIYVLRLDADLAEAGAKLQANSR